MRPSLGALLDTPFTKRGCHRCGTQDQLWELTQQRCSRQNLVAQMGEPKKSSHCGNFIDMISDMRVVGTDKLSEFLALHPPARTWVRTWLADARLATWGTPNDVKFRYSTVSFLPDNMVIFNVKGNDYRLVTQVAYKTKIVAIRWIGTHAEYSKINWEKWKNEARSY